MNRLLKNISLTFLSRLVFLIVGLLINIVVARFLGPAGRGVVSLLNEFFFIAAIVAISGVHEANILYLGNKRFQHGDIFTNAIYQTVIASSLFIILFFILKNWLLLSLLRNVDERIFLTAMILLPAIVYQNHVVTMLLGHKNIKAYNLIWLLHPICALILQIILIPRLAIKGAILGNFLGIVIACAVGTSLLMKYGKPNVVPDLNHWRSAFIYGAKSQIGLVLGHFNRRLPIIIINLFLTPKEVGYYAIAIALAELSWYVPESVGVVLFPEISGATKENAAILTAFAARNTLFIISIVGILLGLSGGIIVKLFFGSAFDPSITILRILIPGMVVFSLNRVLCSYFAGTEKPEYGTYTSIVAFLIMLILNFLLIPRIGLMGAPIGATIAFVFSSVAALAIFMKTSKFSLKKIIIIEKEDIKKYSELTKKFKTFIFG